MKRLSFLLFLALFLIPVITYGDSGACSGHGGVSCSAGPDYDGSVVCNDGWRASSVLYTSMAMCGGSNIRHDYSECDKYRTNSNLSKSLAKARYDGCVRNINSGDYEKEWERILQEGDQQVEEIRRQQQYQEEQIRQWEAETTRLEEASRQRIKDAVEKRLQPLVCKKGYWELDGKCTFANNACNYYFGNHASYYFDEDICKCDPGYEMDIANQKCVASVSTKTACSDGFYLHSSGKCITTLQKCQAEFGKEAKIGPNLECLYCPIGYFLNKEWMCEPYESEVKISPQKQQEGVSIEGLLKQSEQVSVTEEPDKGELVGVSAKSPVIERIKGWFRRIFR